HRRSSAAKLKCRPNAKALENNSSAAEKRESTPIFGRNRGSKLRTCSPAAERETQLSASYYLVWRCRDMQSDKFLNDVVSRRHVVAAGLAPLIVPRHVLGGPGYQAPSDTLTIMAVGVGGMGRGYLRSMKGERILAMCDLDPEGYAARAFKAFPQAKMYRGDFREMFDKEKDADVVV